MSSQKRTQDIKYFGSRQFFSFGTIGGSSDMTRFQYFSSSQAEAGAVLQSG
jgi:hypothetical protein